MRIRLEHNGTVFEYERRPMPERRFKALCALAAAGGYVGIVWAVAALCDVPGLLIVVVGTMVAGLVVKGLD